MLKRVVLFRVLSRITTTRSLANRPPIHNRVPVVLVGSRALVNHPLVLRILKSLTKSILISFPIVLTVTRSVPVLAATEHQTTPTATMDDIIKQADQLYMQNKLKEAHDALVPHKDAADVNLQWKFARICYRMGKMAGSSNGKQFAETAMEHIDKAVELDPNSFNAQKWRGIILSWYCDFEGYKKKIERSYEIKQNFDAACKLDPNDPTARHLLGRWSYSVADVPWYMKSAAKYILAELPSATYEDALKIFLEAEQIEEGFFSQNWLYIGKCYYNLSKKSEAKVWLKKASEVTGDDQDDLEARKEALELLKKL